MSCEQLAADERAGTGVGREHLEADTRAGLWSDPPSLPPLAGTPGERLLLFLGGTIGNFEEGERADFLTTVRGALASGDHFLLGADLVKHPARLEAAYDDAAGVDPVVGWTDDAGDFSLTLARAV